MYAHYFASKTRKYLVISKTPACTMADRVDEIEVSGKAEARRVAKLFSACCWNF
jgi:hypothetical protein